MQELSTEFKNERQSWGAIKYHLNILQDNSMVRALPFSRKQLVDQMAPFGMKISAPRAIYAPSFRSLWEYGIYEEAYRFLGEKKLTKWLEASLTSHGLELSSTGRIEVRHIVKTLATNEFRVIDDLRGMASLIMSFSGSGRYRLIYAVDWTFTIFVLTLGYMLHTKRLVRVLELFGIRADSEFRGLIDALTSITEDSGTRFMNKRLTDIYEVSFYRLFFEQILSIAERVSGVPLNVRSPLSTH